MEGGEGEKGINDDSKLSVLDRMLMSFAKMRSREVGWVRS